MGMRDRYKCGKFVARELNVIKTSIFPPTGKEKFDPNFFITLYRSIN
jgi:hypothetical protein